MPIVICPLGMGLRSKLRCTSPLSAILLVAFMSSTVQAQTKTEAPTEKSETERPVIKHGEIILTDQQKLRKHCEDTKNAKTQICIDFQTKQSK